MKLYKTSLLMCGALIFTASFGHSSTNRSVSVPNSEQSADMRDQAYSNKKQKESRAVVEKIEVKIQSYIADAARWLRGKGMDANEASADFLRENDRVSRLVEFDLRGVIDIIESMSDELATLRNLTRKLDVAKEVEFIEGALTFARSTKSTDAIVKTYMLMYAYLRIPGSVGKMPAAAISSNARAAGQFDNEHFRSSVRNTRDLRENESYTAQKQKDSFCPDKNIIGHRVKELFPYFTANAFERGRLKDPVSGDQKELAKIKLNGKWWNVFALDMKNESNSVGYYPTGMTNPAQEFFKNAVRQIAAPYALRFGKTVDDLLSERNVNESRYNTSTMRYTPIVQHESIESRKMKECLSSPDSGGIFWKRDTSFDDGLSQNMCTYVASTFTIGGVVSSGTTATTGAQTWLPSGQRVNYTFVLEPTNEAPALEKRTNSFINRVYAQRRSYHMRNKDLMQYAIGQEEDAIVATGKMTGEFKERVARDRIYQMQNNAYRVYGRIYGVTPSRIYQATRNMSEALDRDQIDDLTSDDFNNRVYAYDYRRTYGPHYTRTYLSESFDGVGTNTTAATVNQDAHADAQYRAEVALRHAGRSIEN